MSFPATTWVSLRSAIVQSKLYQTTFSSVTTQNLADILRTDYPNADVGLMNVTNLNNRAVESRRVDQSHTESFDLEMLRQTSSPDQSLSSLHLHLSKS